MVTILWLHVGIQILLITAQVKYTLIQDGQAMGLYGYIRITVTILFPVYSALEL